MPRFLPWAALCLYLPSRRRFCTGHVRFVGAARNEPDFDTPELGALVGRSLTSPFLDGAVGKRHRRISLIGTRIDYLHTAEVELRANLLAGAQYRGGVVDTLVIEICRGAASLAH